MIANAHNAKHPNLKKASTFCRRFSVCIITGNIKIKNKRIYRIKEIKEDLQLIKINQNVFLQSSFLNSFSVDVIAKS